MGVGRTLLTQGLADEEEDPGAPRPGDPPEDQTPDDAVKAAEAAVVDPNGRRFEATEVAWVDGGDGTEGGTGTDYGGGDDGEDSGGGTSPGYT